MDNKELPAAVVKAGYKGKDVDAFKEHEDRFVLALATGPKAVIWKDEAKQKAHEAAEAAKKAPKAAQEGPKAETPQGANVAPPKAQDKAPETVPPAAPKAAAPAGKK